jgi:hypothetical protein
MQQPERNSKMTMLEVVISITIWVMVVAAISQQLIKLVI